MCPMKTGNLEINQELYNQITEAKSPEECQKALLRVKEQLLQGTDSIKSFEKPKTNDLVEFLKYVGDIKDTERRGWRLRGLHDTETVACHMYRMAVMAMVIPTNEASVDISRCIQMALVHDLAECIVGDITPECGITREDKHQMELEAMHKITLSLSGTEMGRNIMGLWTEYEQCSSKEAIFVHDLDKLEFVLQSMEYENRFGVNLDDFYTNTRARIKNKHLLEFFDSIMAKRGLVNE